MIYIYTDGACLNNHLKINKGAWAFVILNEEGLKIREGVDIEKNTTNNRMEMTAVIESLKQAKILNEKKITLFSDSKYVINTLTIGWKRNKNLDLWKIIDDLLVDKEVTFKWVKGHANNQWNEYVDKLAEEKIENKKFTIIN